MWRHWLQAVLRDSFVTWDRFEKLSVLALSLFGGLATIFTGDKQATITTVSSGVGIGLVAYFILCLLFRSPYRVWRQEREELVSLLDLERTRAETAELKLEEKSRPVLELTFSGLVDLDPREMNSYEEWQDVRPDDPLKRRYHLFRVRISNSGMSPVENAVVQLTELYVAREPIAAYLPLTLQLMNDSPPFLLSRGFLLRPGEEKYVNVCRALEPGGPDISFMIVEDRSLTASGAEECYASLRAFASNSSPSWLLDLHIYLEDSQLRVDAS